MTNIFANINISGKRLENEDFETYKRRRKVINKITKLNSQERILSYASIPFKQKAHMKTIPGVNEKHLLNMFKEAKVTEKATPRKLRELYFLAKIRILLSK